LELAHHSTPDDCWIAVRGKVYDVTRYLDFHPGGRDVLTAHGGRDATAAFDKFHRWVSADGLMGGALVGPLLAEDPGGASERWSGGGQSSCAPPVPDGDDGLADAASDDDGEGAL